MSVAHTLWQAKERSGDAIALTFEGRTWTFRELWQASSAPAAELTRRGIRRGDRVGSLIGNRPEWLFWHIAASRVGAVSVPINPAYTVPEIRTVLGAADLSLLLLDPGLDGAAEAAAGERAVLPLNETVGLAAGSHAWTPPHDEDDESPAVILFSSGSTGQPKGIVHSSRNLRRIAEAVGAVWNYAPNDVLLLSMPLAFVYASVVGWLAGTKRGAAAYLERRFNAAEVAARIDAGELTVLLGVPNMYRALLAAGRPARSPRSRLRVGLTAGDVLPRDLDDAFFRAYGAPLLDIYGLTETPHTVSHFVARDPRTRPLSCGTALPGIGTRIVDEAGAEVAPGEVGELICRTPYTFLGYFRNETATGEVLRDGWFSTGDLVRRDADGYYYIVDRKKELIKRSGFNVLPSEVEAVILACADVLETGVVGVPDPAGGERVLAFVVPAVTGSPSPEAILTECRKQLAKYKVPERVIVLDALPRGATGKLNRKMLRQLARERYA